VSVSFALILGILSVWRVTHLFNAEDGPRDVLARFRRAFGSGFLGQILDCFYCLSLWVAVPFAFLLSDRWTYRLLFWLSFSGGACLLEKLTQRPNEGFPAIYSEDPNPRNENGLLRQSQGSIPGAEEESSHH
jgi:hypothetical protein